MTCDEPRPIKFILYSGELYLSHVDFHKDLLPEGYDTKDTRGGGFATLDTANKIIRVWGRSLDFGYYDNKLIHTCKMPKHLAEYTIEEIKGPDEV